jgi:hypothetical protein
MLRHTLTPGYTGRFQSLAEDYENGGKTTCTDTIKSFPHAPEAIAGIVSVSDYLQGRWHDAFRSIADRICDGQIRARGVAIDGVRRSPNGDMPAASVNDAMSLDVYNTAWEAPQTPTGRRWTEMTINWDDLLKFFGPDTPSRQTAAAETRCREWLKEQMRRSSEQTTMSKMEWYRKACKKFRGLGNAEGRSPSRSFARAWTAAIKDTGAKWDSSGRKNRDAEIIAPN